MWNAHSAGHLQGVQDKGNKANLSICTLHRWALSSVGDLQHLPESRDGSEQQHRGEGCHQFSPQPHQTVRAPSLLHSVADLPHLGVVSCTASSWSFPCHTRAAVGEQREAMTCLSRGSKECILTCQKQLLKPPNIALNSARLQFCPAAPRMLSHILSSALLSPCSQHCLSPGMWPDI